MKTLRNLHAALAPLEMADEKVSVVPAPAPASEGGRTSKSLFEAATQAHSAMWGPFFRHNPAYKEPEDKKGR